MWTPYRIEDFKNNYKDTYLNLWNHEKIAIPCCFCFDILKELFQLNDLEIGYPIEIGRAWVILNNLFKLGFIDDKVRDAKFKEYSENLRNLKEKRILRYFLG